MPDILDTNELFFTPFEPKTKNRFIMYIEGIPSYLVRTAGRPQIQFEEMVLDHINVKRHLKGKATWQTIDVMYMTQSFQVVHKQLWNGFV